MPVVNELFRRHVAGVFACLSEDGELQQRSKPGAGWPLALGLAVRLQHAFFGNSVADERQLLRSTQEEVRTELAIHDGGDDASDLSSYPTDALLAELYRHPGQWVLALRRNRTAEHLPPWDGCLWNGPTIICMGLAAFLQQMIGQCVAQHNREQYRHDAPYPLERRTQEILEPILRQPQFDPLEAGGRFAYLSCESNRPSEGSPIGRNPREPVVTAAGSPATPTRRQRGPRH
jgi:hypothetical protein